MLPTPTPLPAVSPDEMLVTIHAEDWGIWNYTDEAVQIWNRTGDGTLAIQWAVVIIIVVVFVVVLINLVQSLTRERE